MLHGEIDWSDDRGTGDDQRPINAVPVTKVLILGGHGQVGRELVRLTPSNVVVAVPSHSQCDVTDRATIDRTVSTLVPDVIVNLAAYTAVDRAETDSEKAFAVNADGARNVAAAASRTDARLVHISTDYVFDGLSRDPYPTSAQPNPINVYGASKLAGEEAVRELTSKGTVIRSGWLFSAHGNGFVQKILKRALEGAEIRVVDDQRGTPTAAADLASVIWRCVADPGVRGVFHYANAGEATWREFACEIIRIARELGLVPHEPSVTPVTSRDFAAAAVRPMYSVLDSSDLVRRLGLQIRPWKLALREVMAEVHPAEAHYGAAITDNPSRA